MTDFDAKLAELEANSDRVPELKLVVELLRMLAPGAIDGRCIDPSHLYVTADNQMRAVCSTCGRPKMPKF